MHIIVERAKKDIAVESALNSFEEVWLSYSFHLVPHHCLVNETEASTDVNIKSRASSGPMSSTVFHPTANNSSSPTNYSHLKQRGTSSSSSNTSQIALVKVADF